MSIENGMPLSSWTGDVVRNFRENPIHESVHVPEMYEIANEIVEKRVPELARQECARLINETVDSMIGAIHYDVNTALELSCKDLNEMLTSKRTRQFVSDAICKEITKHLKDIKLDIKM